MLNLYTKIFQLIGGQGKECLTMTEKISNSDKVTFI